ncbi:MAG: hypothetical protein V3S39_11035 [Thermodesulfobacteriota bacterium]
MEGKKAAVISRYSLNWLATAEWMGKTGLTSNVHWVELAFPHQDKALRTKTVERTVLAAGVYWNRLCPDSLDMRCLWRMHSTMR